MAQAQHLIELNGQLYDAATGRIVSGKDHSPKPQHQAVDGFVKKTITVSDQPAPKRRLRPTAGTRTPAKTTYVSAQKSQTLMRSAVKKPAHKPTKHATASITKPQAVSPVRQHRAGKVSRSKLISRFGARRTEIEAQVMPLAVQAAPTEAADLMNHHTPAVTNSHSSRGSAVLNAHGKTTHKKVDFEKALHQATSHTQPKSPKPKLSHRIGRRLRLSPKVTKISAMIASVLLLGGFFLHQNLPNISMRIAAAKAGVDARLPDYKPAGFGLSNAISYSPGQITVQYKSNSDERSFALTQASTDLNNEAVLDKEISAKKQTYQTLESQGKTIYIYDGSNAAWVDDGTLYKIEGNSSLSSEQLLRVAGSL